MSADRLHDCARIVNAMRTHQLSQLDVEGREKVLRLEPLFDFYRVERIRAVAIGYGEGGDAEGTHLELTAEYHSEARRYMLTIRFEGVRELVLPEMRPFLWLPEMEIEDVTDRQLEETRFEVVSHFDRSFRCSCQKITVVSFDPVDG